MCHLMIVRGLVILGVSGLLSGCASWFEDRIQYPPTPLADIKPEKTLTIKWSVSQGATNASFVPLYENGIVISADSTGHIRSIDALTGKITADVDVKQPLSSGVAVAGETLFVGARAAVMAVERTTGKQLWQQPLTSLVLETPQVLGQTVVVKTNDGRLTGLLAADGHQQWVQGNVLPALIVRNQGSMQAVGQDILMVGQASGKVDIIRPQNGAVLWQGTVATPHGATELERATDIVSRPVFDRGQVCAVAYQGRIACFDSRTGNLIWGQDNASSRGLTYDTLNIYVTDAEGVIWAYNRFSGRQAWKSEALKYRDISGPAMLGNAVMVSDGEGYIHLLSHDSGRMVGRLKTSALNAASQPLSLGSSALVQGKNGKLMLVAIQ